LFISKLIWFLSLFHLIFSSHFIVHCS
jgi:hypothetical protein